MSIGQSLAAAVLGLAAISNLQAASLNADGQWAPFDVDELSAISGGLEWIDLSSGNALSYSFSIAAGYLGKLTVVDAAFSGDRFRISNGSAVLGETSLPVNSYPDSIGLDFDAALADSRYSSATFTLGAGSHDISGVLIGSALADGMVLNATVGAVRLSVTPVPEPATVATLLAGLALLSVALRRRGNSK